MIANMLDYYIQPTGYQQLLKELRHGLCIGLCIFFNLLHP